MDRRHFFKAGAAGLAMLNFTSMTKSIFPATKGAAGIGICDWNLGPRCDPEQIPIAKKANLQGIQVSVGLTPDNIPLRKQSVRDKYHRMGQEYGITFHSVAAGSLLNKYPLAFEPQSAVFVIDAIEAAKALGATNILMAFFGAGDLRLKNVYGEYRNKNQGKYASYELDTKAVKQLVDVLIQIAPRAEDAGITLGLENTLTATQNLEIIDRVGSEMLQVYYDVGNSWAYGYNVPQEIRVLGNSRICEVHLKDWQTKILGSKQGQVDMQECSKALSDIGYDKWLVLETSGRKDHFLEDTKTNVDFVKQTFQMA